MYIPRLFIPLKYLTALTVDFLVGRIMYVCRGQFTLYNETAHDLD